MRHARTPKFQLSGPTVHSLYCDIDEIDRLVDLVEENGTIVLS